MSAVQPPPAATEVSKATLSAFDHDNSLKEHLARVGVHFKQLTTLAAFEYLKVLGAGVVGAIVLQVQSSNGNRFAVLPLATGDETSSIKNTGLQFIDTMSFDNLDNKLVKFKIANGSSDTGPSSCVISFTATTEAGGNIATLTLTNGQLGWLGSSGYCTFFPTPAQP
ncbi:hypothetical protein CALCODRAFT_515165 [Calocera cornea HHB12733]|uniref:Uncharacterized protein n=1 Tax=Calocera cornea HHB12733 TaxID=1353952 RepID=A0A165IN73_9BASI|nr:hypothetical protein CALCODRAFT_515165 [Calocera cornea HHB12733]